jgi:hypothetical protein
MFKNVGGKLRTIAIIFFVFNCIISALLLVAGIIGAVLYDDVYAIIGSVAGGILGAAIWFGMSLIPIYIFYGYGTLIKSCEENARTNEAILAFLNNNNVNACQPAQPAQPVQPVQPVEAPVVEAPVVEAPVVEEPVVEEPVVEAPVVEEPVAEEPAVEAPAAPVADDADFVSDDGEEKTVVIPKEGEPLVKRCPSCGNVVRPQANFCNQCGYKMK